MARFIFSWRVRNLLVCVIAIFVGACGGSSVTAPTSVVTSAWDVTFESRAPSNVPDNSLFFELVNRDAISQGFVDIAVQVRNIGPRLVRSEGSVTYGPVQDGAAQPVSFRNFSEGGFFERAGQRVLYKVSNLSLFQEVSYDIAIDGSSAGANGTGTFVTMRFDLRRTGDAKIGEGLLAFATTADGKTFGFDSLNEHVYGGTLRVRQH